MKDPIQPVAYHVQART